MAEYLVGRSDACGISMVHRILTNGSREPMLVGMERAAGIAREVPYLSTVFDAELLLNSRESPPEEGKSCVVGDVSRRDRENRTWVYVPIMGKDGRPVFMSEEDAMRKARRIFEEDSRGPLPSVLDAGPLFGYETGREYVPRVEEE